MTAASPTSMPILIESRHNYISIPNDYHIQNNYALTMPNGTTTYLHDSVWLRMLAGQSDLRFFLA